MAETGALTPPSLVPLRRPTASLPFSGAAGEVRFANVGQNGMIYGDVDGDGVADFEIGVAKNQPLGADDFIF